MADATNTPAHIAGKYLCPVCGKSLYKAGDAPSQTARRKHCSIECFATNRVRRDPRDRFEKKVDRSPGQGPNGTCHQWTAAVADHGYGTFEMDGRALAHRTSYILSVGPIPEGMQVLHRCDNRRCVNPNHLFLGSQADNMADMIEKGRGNPRRGERARSAKLQPADVVAILQDSRHPKTIAAQYGVSDTAIRYIQNGKAWKHIPRREE